MQSKGRIDVSAVSLVDLKAEIARRRCDVKSKSTAVPNVSGTVLMHSDRMTNGGVKRIFKRPISPPPAPISSKADDKQMAEDAELEKSRRSLQAKAKLYEALRQTAAPQMESCEDNDTDPLVDFERKAMEDCQRRIPDRLEYNSSDSDDDTDRRYRCKHKRDGDDYYSAEPVSIPDGPVTYTHLRQDEVRDHGTGFYAFSADAETRAAEQAALRELRRRTERAREQTEAERSKRSIAMAARLARLRARKGLPDVATAAANLLTVQEEPLVTPEEIAPALQEVPQVPQPTGGQLGSDDLDIASMLRRLRDEAEQKQVDERVEPVIYTAPVQNQARKGTREWDRGKSLVHTPTSSRPTPKPPSWTPLGNKKLESQRQSREEERYPDFAPPSFYR